MSEVISPAPGQTVITTDLRDHHRHHGFDSVESRADFRALTAEVERFGTINGDRTLTGVQVTGDRINTVGAATALAAGHTDQLVQAAACRTDSLVQAGFGDTSDRICASTKDVTGALSVGFTASALAACKTSDEVAAVYAALQKQVSDAATATVVGFKDAQATAYQIEGRTALDAAKNVATLGLQATTNANLLSVEASKNFYALDVAATKNAAAAELRAQQIAAEAAAKAAECCCRLEMQAAANLAAITATVTAGFTAVTSKMDQNVIDELRAFKASIPRGIPVTIPVAG